MKLFILLLLLAQPVAAQETWITLNGLSYHYDRSKEHNETNEGIGVEHRIARDWALLGGTYENSYWRRSWYAGASWMPWHHGPVHFGFSGGAVTGYEGRPVSLFLMPTMAIQNKQFGVNVGVVPSFSAPFTVIGVQFKWHLKTW